MKIAKRLKRGILIAGIACIVLLTSVAGLSSCAQKNLTNVVPFVPPSYYNSTLMLPFDLSSAYFSPYITRTDAQRRYEGQSYVFKGFIVTQQMLSTAGKGYVWVDLVKAYPLNPSNITQLTVGETIDVVGIMAGGCKDFPNSMTFSGVVFLPTGFIQLPMGDASQFQYTPTY